MVVQRQEGVGGEVDRDVVELALVDPPPDQLADDPRELAPLRPHRLEAIVAERDVLADEDRALVAVRRDRLDQPVPERRERLDGMNYLLEGVQGSIT